jgi:5-methylphenazine-1-carboxylate 1-monooxygenase
MAENVLVAGRIALLGDTAHPMYTVGPNGDSQAIADVTVLAEELSRAKYRTDTTRSHA